MAASDERRREALVRAPVRRLQRHLNRGVWLNAGVAPLWVAATAFAGWRFLVRFETVAFGVLCGGLCLLGWAWRAREDRLSFAQAAAMTDKLGELNGLLLTRLETSLGAWELELNTRVREVPLPSVALRRAASLCVLACLFSAVVAAIPAPTERTLPRNAAAATKLAELDAKAEALAREEPVDQQMKDELSRLREDLERGQFDAADWEAADGLSHSMEQKAAEGASELAKAQAAADALASSLANNAGEEAATREEEALEQALMELSDGEAKDGKEALQKALSSEGEQKSGAAGESKQGASKSQAEALKKALAQRQSQLQNAFGQKGSQGAEGEGAGDKPANGAQAKAGAGNASSASAGQSMKGEKSTEGGPSRGGGPGELSFDDHTELHPERLAFEALPKGQGGEPGELWGLRRADPRPFQGAAGNVASAGNASGEQSPGRQHEVLLPRNRELVRRYFSDSK